MAFGDYGDFLDPGLSEGAGLGGSLASLESLNLGAPSSYSWGDIASKVGSGVSSFGNFAKAAMPIAQLGLAGLGAAEGIMGANQLGKQTQIAERAAKTQQQVAGDARAAAAPVQQFSQEELANASAGKIPAPIQSQIDLWKQAAKQQVMDYAARSGQGDSSSLTNWLMWIDKQAEAMMASSLEQEQQLGIQAGGTAGGILSAASGAAGGAGATASNQQQGIQQLIGSANQVLARLTAAAA